MVQRISLATVWLLAGISWTALAAGQDYDPAYDQVGGYGPGTLDERVGKLEKRLSSGTISEMLTRMEQLQNDVLKMRGEIEQLNHEVDKLKKQQKDMYTDIDQRLQAGAPPASPTPESGQEPQAGTDGGLLPPPVAVTPRPIIPATTLPTPRPIATPVPANDPAVREAAYQKGFNLLKDGKYPESVREFKKFLAAYPGGDLVDNAVYWMGEAYYVLRDFPNSREAFRKVVKEFPQSAKASDALLKIGYIEYDSGQWAKSRDVLNEVVKNYPGSSAAKLAEKRLAKIKQEAH
jgi:tol-pal system protein YbgF